MAPQMYKDAVVAAGSDDTRVTDAFSGLYARALRNTFAEEYEASGAPVLPPLLQSRAAEDIYLAAARAGVRDYFPLWAGQSAGLIAPAGETGASALPGAADVVRTIVEEMEATLARLSLAT